MAVGHNLLVEGDGLFNDGGVGYRFPSIQADRHHLIGLRHIPGKSKDIIPAGQKQQRHGHQRAAQAKEVLLLEDADGLFQEHLRGQKAHNGGKEDAHEQGSKMNLAAVQD